MRRNQLGLLAGALSVAFILFLINQHHASSLDLPTPKDKPIATFWGKGFKNTRPFIVQSAWEATWTDTSGNMNISLNDANTGSILDPVFVIIQDSKEGTSFHPHSGAFFLSVMSMGEWTISIKEVPLP